MKPDDYPSDLHVGDLIKEIADKRGVSDKTLAYAIGSYQENPDRIYSLDNMDCENVIKISYLLGYNFLKVISETYLLHLPVTENRLRQENYYIDLNLKTKNFITNIGNCDFLQEIHIGQYIRAIAHQNGWHEQDMAKLLHRTQSSISDLYGHKSLKIKRLIEISEILKRNLIAEVYLSKMFIISSPDMFTHCTMTITPQEIRIENPHDKAVSMVFRRQDDEK